MLDGIDRKELSMTDVMMQPEIRKARVKKYGSFLYCPDRDTLCFGRYTEDGSCKHESCILDDPEYIALQERIDKNRIINVQAEKEKKEDMPAPIRRQTITREQQLIDEIKHKEEKAAWLYKKNWPGQADNAMYEAAMLKNQLRKIQGG